MPENCIFCNVFPDQFTVEHIIPSCIRGKLKSSKLICRNCNSQFGTELDVVLKNRFELIEGFLSIKKGDRKKSIANLKFKGRDIILTPEGIKFKHPRIIKKIKNGIEMVFPSDKSMRKHYKKMKKKYPDIDIEKIMKESKKDYVPFDEPLVFESDAPLDLTWRACAKIIYEYLFALKRNTPISNENIKKFILNGENLEEIPLCLYHKYEPITRNINHIYHTIIIDARNNENILIGYLELYSSLKIIFVIDVDYTGPTLLNGYYLDLMTGEQFTFIPKNKIPLSKHELISYIEVFDLEESGNEFMHNFIKASSKARLYPIQEKLNLLYLILKKVKFPEKINKLSYIYSNLITELDRIGLESIEKKTYNYEYEYLSEIARILSRLTNTFLEWEMTSKIINQIYQQLI